MTEPPLMQREGAVNARTSGASIVQVGVSERSLLLFVWLPVALSALASVAALSFATYSIGASQTAAYAAQTAERNAKLAQYQLEEALKRHNLEVPHE